jgi:subtilisin family serine protease
MRGGVGTPGSYITCFEWLLAPYPQGGDPFTDGNPQLAADVINNSWGCPPSEGCDAESLRQIVDTMRAAGILVVASAGNEGGGGLGASVCSSVQNPIAIYDSVLSVGAHGQNGQIAYFSSRGPVIVDGSGRRKPDIAAPGVAVFSTKPTARGRYGFESGTSMASPHVAGAVALLWSALPELKGDIDRTEELLLRAATPVLDNNCDPDGPPQAPNNVYGAGRLDVLAAIEMMQGVTLTIKVDLPWVAETSGKTWRLVELRTGAARTAIGGSDGTVTWGGAGQAALLSGTYVVLRPGCVDYVAADVVTLAPGETVTRDVSLAGAVCLALPDIGK